MPDEGSGCDMDRTEIGLLYHSDLFELTEKAHTILIHNNRDLQKCRLLSVKTGACPEDCGYCAQSAHHKTGIEKHALLPVPVVLEEARKALEDGATRFCMGAAWREVKDGQDFDSVLEMVKGVSTLGLEACVTLGMVNSDQAQRLKAAGLTAYNHNLDTGPVRYPRIVRTRTYAERIETLQNIASAGISVCCGCILGIGETHDDRIDFLWVLKHLPKEPESVPINVLQPVPGTPLSTSPPVSVLETIRMIAVTRILFPSARVRLSAGRINFTAAETAFALYAGADSIFTGEKLLTSGNPGETSDEEWLSQIHTRKVR